MAEDTTHVSCWLDLAFADAGLRDPHDQAAGQLAGGRTRYGWFVYAPSCAVAAAAVPEDLAAVLHHARALGCEYVLLDCDAPPVPGLAIRHPDVLGDVGAEPC